MVQLKTLSHIDFYGTSTKIWLDLLQGIVVVVTTSRDSFSDVRSDFQE